MSAHHFSKHFKGLVFLTFWNLQNHILWKSCGIWSWIRLKVLVSPKSWTRPKIRTSWKWKVLKFSHNEIEKLQIQNEAEWFYRAFGLFFSVYLQQKQLEIATTTYKKCPMKCQSFMKTSHGPWCHSNGVYWKSLDVQSGLGGPSGPPLRHEAWTINNKIRRPPLWGPPGCEGSCVVPFPVYHVSYVPSSQSQDSQFRFQDL